MAYPLPPTQPYSTNLRWLLVAVPDEVDFMRAALGAYTDFGYRHLWGKEGKEPGREEAAQRWQDAIAATLEALEMGFPDILLGHIDELEAKLDALALGQQTYSCCSPTGANLPQYPGEFVWSQGQDWVDDNAPPDQYTSGLPPAFQTNPLADYDSSGTIAPNDYEVYLCDGATRLANSLETVLKVLQFNAFTSVREIVGTVLKALFPGRIDDLLIWGWETYYAAVEALGNLITGLPQVADWDNQIWPDWTSSVRQGVICEILDMWDEDAGAFLSGADATGAAIRTLMQSLYTSGTWGFFWSYFPFETILRHMIEGKEQYEGPLTAECAACGNEQPSGVYWDDNGQVATGAFPASLTIGEEVILGRSYTFDSQADSRGNEAIGFTLREVDGATPESLVMSLTAHTHPNTWPHPLQLKSEANVEIYHGVVIVDTWTMHLLWCEDDANAPFSITLSFAAV